MRLFAEERKGRTEQLLLTAPVTITGMVLGKYLAALTLFVSTVLVSCVNFIPIYLIADTERAGDSTAFTHIGPNTAQLVGSLVAVLLLGAAFIAIGMLVSSLTENQLSAAVITIGVLAVMVLLNMLNSIKDCTLSVRGNCEAEVDQVVLEFPIMADYTILNVNGITITATHGHTYNQKKPLPFCNEILLCGHTHVPACEVFDNFTYLNPGSVSMPKNDTKHSYMILEDRTFVWKDLMTSKKYAECTVK
jgi:putative phosphoesterase